MIGSKLMAMTLGALILFTPVFASAQSDEDKAIEALDKAMGKAKQSAAPEKQGPGSPANHDASASGKTAEDFIASGRANYAARNYDQAIADLTKAIEMKPDSAVAYKFRGNAWSGKGNRDQAIADLTKAIQIKPDYRAAYNNTGNIWLESGDFDQAIANYTKAIEVNPGHPFAYAKRAFAWKEKGELAKAKADAEKARQLDPSINVPAF
ncbi:MAG: tetratricopeptide repeat protein [Desulfovibrionaceae bacterium]|nr:tetratricopeptide repeat protein [Desulfovibrionaceae bacterium]MBF0512849.1 tetratricopeptide repeat protein [Desulfovibrionaceae bacterium]